MFNAMEFSCGCCQGERFSEENKGYIIKGGNKNLFMTPPLDSHSTTEPKPDMLLSVSTRNSNLMSWKMYVALYMRTHTEKTTFS